MPNIAKLRAAIAALAGQPVLEWRNGYGNSGSLHIGIRVAERDRQAAGFRGSSVLNVWDAHVRFHPNELEGEHRRHPPAELRALSLESLVGRAVSKGLVADDGTLSIWFVPSGELVVSPAIESTERDEQWAIESEEHGTLIVLHGPQVVEDSEYAPE